MKIGIISGHHFPRLFKNAESLSLETPFGTINVDVSSLEDNVLFFINRHGTQATIPPHNINYRGNIYAFAVSHVDYILSFGTVGSMNTSMKPGDVVVPHDFIDCTTSRKKTFFDEERFHVDMSQPFCPSIRKTLLHSIHKQKGTTVVHKKGIYLTTEGPRLETPAEISFYKHSADIVGMTLAPEAILAREKGICFASLCLICNMAAGLQKALTAEEIAAMYAQKKTTLSTIMKDACLSLPANKTCSCHENVTKATL
ncbi:MAG: MTAP family purine nucleoside phosphorylase [Candidatus Thermoplasmatota archaeon]|nr:MTAP family purine nucleoside phosphorylase [Candidatus Thermoplasmatota archaeon]